jgi:hypothetical protein
MREYRALLGDLESRFHFQAWGTFFMENSPSHMVKEALKLKDDDGDSSTGDDSDKDGEKEKE